MNRNNNWLIAVLVLLSLVLLACCVLAVASAIVGRVADDAVYGPMMREQWQEGACPGCPEHGPMGMRGWLGPVLVLALGLLLLALLAAVAIGALLWARRSGRPIADAVRDVPEMPESKEQP